MQSVHDRLRRLEQRISTQAQNQTNNVPPSAITIKDQPQSQPLSLLLATAVRSGDLPISSVKQYLIAAVNSILHSEGTSISVDDIFGGYFEHISKWLPIVSRRQFQKDLATGWSVERKP
jgi:hypothetical protein